MFNIHASCVSWQNKGILIIGKSGSGKSDLCLRLIQEYGAFLVADDRVNLNVSHETIFATSPDNIKHLLEVRGIGILNPPSVDACAINMVVELVDKSEVVERLPDNEFWTHGGIQIPLIRIHAFEVSATHKIIAALSWKKKQ